MDPVVVIALLSAAVLHSSWHALVKVSGDKMVSLAGMNVVSTLAGVLFLPFVPLPGPASWGILAVSVVLHNAYKLALARLYRLGDLSLGYPVARGMTPIFAGLLGIVLLGELPGVPQWAGIGLISTGLVVLAGGKARPSGQALLMAAAVSLSAAAYSVVDARGVRLDDWLGYTVWLVVLDGICFVLLTNGVRRGLLWQALASAPGRTLLSGALGLASFGVFLWALGRGAVGGVVALRETSALFAMLIGTLVLKERMTGRRLLALVLVTGGVALPALM